MEDLKTLIKSYEDSPDNSQCYQDLVTFCHGKLVDINCQSGDGPMIVRALADSARSVTGREVVVKSDIIRDVVKSNWDSEETVIQVCRLGGNLCFDNPAGRTCILEAEVLDKISNVMEEKLRNDTPSKCWFLVPSLLHNYCNENLGSLTSANKLILIAARHFQNAENKQENIDQVENFVTFLSGLQQHEGKSDLFTEKNIVTSLVHILENFDFESSIVSVLDLLQELFEDEKICNEFVENRVVCAIMKRTEGLCVTESGEAVSEDVASQALDLLALLSSHSCIVPKILTSELDMSLSLWMTSPPSPHHLATAALVAGNMATSDSSVLQLLDTAIPGLLISHVSPGSPGKVLHAVIGCLRNLAVCLAARDKLSQLGLMETSCKLLVSLSSGTDHTVTPKLLSTIRLVTQGKADACMSIGTDVEIVHAIVKIGQYSLVPGLSIEATRLLSSLIRYSKDSEVLRISAVEKVTPLLLNLLNSPHSQLINETLVSLCLLSAPLPPIAEVVEGIDPEFLSNKILEIIDLQEDQCPKEVKYNAFSLIFNIMKWNLNSISEQFKQSGIQEKLSPYESDLAFIGDLKALLI